MATLSNDNNISESTMASLAAYSSTKAPIEIIISRLRANIGYSCSCDICTKILASQVFLENDVVVIKNSDTNTWTAIQHAEVYDFNANQWYTNEEILLRLSDSDKLYFIKQQRNGCELLESIGDPILRDFIILNLDLIGSGY